MRFVLFSFFRLQHVACAVLGVVRYALCVCYVLGVMCYVPSYVQSILRVCRCMRFVPFLVCQEQERDRVDLHARPGARHFWTIRLR